MTTSEHEIEVDRQDGHLRVAIGTKVSVTAGSVEALVDRARGLGFANPFALERGKDVRITLQPVERAMLLASLEPGEYFLGALLERYEELSEDCLFSDLPPIDGANLIDGQPWGWLATSESSDHFGLVPLADPVEIAEFGAWMSQSMTGAVITWGLRMFGEDVAVLWYQADESDPGTSHMDPIYDTSDRGSLLGRVVNGWSTEYFSAECPQCAADGDSEMWGWELTLQADPDMFTLQDQGRALAQVWKPCAKHSRGAVTISNAGTEWRWESGHWIAVA